MKILVVNSSINGLQSISHQLSSSMLQLLNESCSVDSVKYCDLSESPPPHLGSVELALRSNASGIAGSSSAFYETALGDFLLADIIIVGAPMYNFGVPSQLKSWLDALAVAGTTFRYSEEGPQGLCHGKRIIIMSTRGGLYHSPVPMEGMDYHETHLVTFFRFLGIDRIEIVRAEGLNISPAFRENSIKDALRQIAELPLS